MSFAEFATRRVTMPMSAGGKTKAKAKVTEGKEVAKEARKATARVVRTGTTAAKEAVAKAVVNKMAQNATNVA